MALLDKLDDLRGKATEMMQSGVAIATQNRQHGRDEDAMRRAYLAIAKCTLNYMAMHQMRHSPQNVTVFVHVSCASQKTICAWHK